MDEVRRRAPRKDAALNREIARLTDPFNRHISSWRSMSTWLAAAFDHQDSDEERRKLQERACALRTSVREAMEALDAAMSLASIEVAGSGKVTDCRNALASIDQNLSRLAERKDS